MARTAMPSGPRRGPCCGLSTSAQSAGERVSATIAEMIMAVETVTANCANSAPERPGMKPTGTKTESSTSVIAMIGPVICDIAFLVASAGVRFGSSSMTRSTFSTTTMASSTTMPMASTMASSETVLAEKPSSSSTAKVPIRLTGTAMVGITVARMLPRNSSTTITTSTKASTRVTITSFIVSCTKVEVS